MRLNEIFMVHASNKNRSLANFINLTIEIIWKMNLRKKNSVHLFFRRNKKHQNYNDRVFFFYPKK